MRKVYRRSQTEMIQIIFYKVEGTREKEKGELIFVMFCTPQDTHTHHRPNTAGRRSCTSTAIQLPCTSVVGTPPCARAAHNPLLLSPLLSSSSCRAEDRAWYTRPSKRSIRRGRAPRLRGGADELTSSPWPASTSSRGACAAAAAAAAEWASAAARCQAGGWSGRATGPTSVRRRSSCHSGRRAWTCRSSRRRPPCAARRRWPSCSTSRGSFDGSFGRGGWPR